MENTETMKLSEHILNKIALFVLDVTSRNGSVCSSYCILQETSSRTLKGSSEIFYHSGGSEGHVAQTDIDASGGFPHFCP